MRTGSLSLPLVEDDDAQQPRPQVRSASFCAAEIMHGIKHNQFEPFFQPEVELATGRVTGARALARWRHAHEGWVLPDAYVKVLEDAGEIDALTWVVLRKSLAFCSVLNATGTRSSIAVKLSLKSFDDVKFADRVIDSVRNYGLDASNVCLELTDAAATSHQGAALENLARLRMNGFGLSIGDFGTGYSSMQQLMRIPFTELKIDRSFVLNSVENEAIQVILKSSLRLAKALNMEAVAEGVATRQHWDLLQDLGCDLAQGNFIAKPMAAGAYLNWIDNLTANPRSIFFT